MIMVQPTEWRTNSNAVTAAPISLLSGNRLTYILDITTVYAFQRAGMPLAAMTVRDYISVMYKNPGPNGQPAHAVPTPYTQYIPT